MKRTTPSFMGLPLAAALIVSVVIAAGPFQVRAESAPSQPVVASVPGRILVKMRANVKGAERASLHAAHAAKVAREMLQLGVDAVEVPADAMDSTLAGYRSDPRVQYAEPDFVGQGQLDPNDPYYAASQQYDLLKIQMSQAWTLATGSANVMAAVLDSGADFSHPDLQGKLVAGWDFVNNDADPSDDLGHGTHIAGTVGARTNNATGVAGVGFNTQLLVVKVIDQNNSFTYSNLAQAVIYATDHGARIINLSVCGGSDSATLLDAVEYAWNKGVVLVAAAGNYNSSASCYPAAYAHVMDIAATDASDNRWSQSNYGDHISVAAPGVSILSTDWQAGAGAYSVRSGTSMAVPHVVGLAALLFAQNPARTNADVRSIIESTADDLGTAGWDQYYGYGRVNAYHALAVGAPVPTPTPTTVPPTPTPTAVPNIVHIGDLDKSATAVNGSYWRASVTIAVHDGNHNPVANAKVTGAWSNGFSGSAGCVTATTGKCTVTTGNVSKKKAPVTFSVSGISLSSYSYQPGLNQDPDGDSNGTQIAINWP